MIISYVTEQWTLHLHTFDFHGHLKIDCTKKTLTFIDLAKN